MLEPIPSTETTDAGRAVVVSVLLVMQAGFGALSALGLLVFARITGSLGAIAGPALPALLLPLLLLALAAGMAACRTWARKGTLALEAVLLLFAILRLLLSRGETLALAPLLTTFVLPVAVLALLLAPANRRAIAARPAVIE